MAKMCPKQQLPLGCVAAHSSALGSCQPVPAPNMPGGWCWGSLQLGWGSRAQKGSPSSSCEEAKLLVLGAGCRKHQALLTFFRMDSCCVWLQELQEMPGEAEELHKQALPGLQSHCRDRSTPGCHTAASQNCCSAKACPHALGHSKVSQLQEWV